MIDLRLGDCLDIMPTLEAQSFDAIIADIPYGTTACKWDTVIPFAPMWANLERLAKPKAAIVLFGSQPFTSALVMSNPDWFRYEWIWEKGKATQHTLCKTRPLKAHENISVFSSNGHVYNPQFDKGEPYKARINPVHKKDWNLGNKSGNDNNGFRFPRSVIKTKSGDREGSQHPTQKPVALLEYLVRTYTNEGDTVLDFTMGSGTCGVACVKTGRKFVGIEKEPAYFEIAQRRIAEAQAQLALPLK